MLYMQSVMVRASGEGWELDEGDTCLKCSGTPNNVEISLQVHNDSVPHPGFKSADVRRMKGAGIRYSGEDKEKFAQVIGPAQENC